MAKYVAKYIDSFVVPVPKKNLANYRKVAMKAGKIWMEHGALQYVECVGDDVERGKSTSFPQAVKLKAGEVVFFSWIVYKSKAHRNAVLKKVMQNPRITAIEEESMPFDGMRMFWGGFKTFVSLSK